MARKKQDPLLCGGERNGHPHQYSCLQNPMDRGASVDYYPWSCQELNTTEQLAKKRNIFKGKRCGNVRNMTTREISSVSEDAHRGSMHPLTM